MRKRLLPLVLMLAVGPWGCAENTALVPRGEAIVGGVPSSRASVVALKNDLASGFCTATMIAPRIAVTAKHCVQRPGATGPDDPSHYTLRSGEDFENPVSTHEVQSLFAPPGVYTSQSSEEDGTLYGVDVGLVVLNSPSELPVQPIRLEPPVNPLMQAFVTVGYGLTEKGDMGRKREVSLMATEVMVDRIIAGPVVCLGDSGGPLLQQDDGAVVGVTSYGIGTCGDGSTAFNTFARLSALFEKALHETQACLRDAQCRPGETCRKRDATIGECKPVSDAAAYDGGRTDAATDAMLDAEAVASAAGGACTALTTQPGALWWLFTVFALARRSRSPVACTPNLFRRQP